GELLGHGRHPRSGRHRSSQSAPSQQIIKLILSNLGDRHLDVWSRVVLGRWDRSRERLICVDGREEVTSSVSSLFGDGAYATAAEVGACRLAATRARTVIDKLGSRTFRKLFP